MSDADTSSQNGRHEVLLEREASTEEVKAVQKAFDEAGIPSVAAAGITRKSTGQLPWVIQIFETGYWLFLCRAARSYNGLDGPGALYQPSSTFGGSRLI